MYALSVCISNLLGNGCHSDSRYLLGLYFNFEAKVRAVPSKNKMPTVPTPLIGYSCSAAK